MPRWIIRVRWAVLLAIPIMSAGRYAQAAATDSREAEALYRDALLRIEQGAPDARRMAMLQELEVEARDLLGGASVTRSAAFVKE